MTVNRTTLLDLPLPVTGTESGVWGDVTNNGLTQYLDIAIAGRNALTSSDFSAGALTISLTEGDSSATNIAAGSAQYATLYVSSLAQNSTITAPSSNRAYRVVNADATYTLTVKAAGQTGVVFPVNTSGTVVFNGTDYVLLGSYVIASAGTASLPSITFTGDTNTGIFSPAADTIAFTEGGAESMRINSSGNLGLGVTPSAWAGAYKAIQFGIDGVLNATTSTGNGVILSKNFFNDGSANKYINTDYASFYQQVTGQHQWFTAASGTAGNTITFTQAMTLDASGFLGIGNTTPRGRLSVGADLNNGATDASTGINLKQTSTTAATGIYLERSGERKGYYIYVGAGNDALAFQRNNAGTKSDVMVLDRDGNVGIGTTSPVAKLDVQGALAISNNSTSYWKLDRNDSDGSLQFIETTTERARITDGGDLFINTTNTLVAGRKLQVVRDAGGPVIFKVENGVGNEVLLIWNNATSGNNLFQEFATEGSITIRGSIDYNRAGGAVRYNTTSDATLKNIIGDADGQKSLEILNSTRIREYAWKDDPTQKPQIGVIAQELYETFKGAVSVGGEVEETDDDGNVITKHRHWAVDKTAFTFHLVAGWQAHEKKIAEQQAKIDALETRLAALEAK